MNPHRFPSWLLASIAALALGACTDATNVSPEGDAGPDQGPIEDPDSGLAPDAAVVPDMAPPDMAPPQPAWVEVELAPRRPIYALDATVTVTAVAFDRFGEPLPDEAVRFDVAPAAIGQIDEAGVLTFASEGPATVLACAGMVCGRAAVFVDDGPPTLVVESPERGEILDGEGGDTLTVAGSAVDSAGPVTVRVNGVQAQTDDEGRFSVAIPATFGVNRVEVTADDGVQPDPAYDVRDVLWAADYEAVEGDGVTLTGAVSLRIDQALLDTDNPVEVPDDGGVLRAGDVAQVLDMLVQLVELDSLLGDPQIAEGEPLDLRIESVDLGRPDVEMIFTAEGLELFLVLPAVEVQTSGRLVIEDEQIDLTGSIDAEVAAFATLQLTLEDALAVTVGEVQVNLESIRGNYASDTANALIDSLGTLLGNLVRDLAQDLISGLIADQLPALVDSALDTVLGTIGDIPLQFETGIDGVPPLDLALQITPAGLHIERATLLQLMLDARVQHPGPVEAPHPDPGVPVLSSPEWVEVQGEGIGASMRLALLNGLLHEVWRTRLLNIQPPLPDELAGLLGDVVLDARMPPVVVPARLGSEFPLTVQIGDLRMSTQAANADAADVYAISLAVGAGIHVDGAQIELRLADEPDVDVVRIEQGQEFPLLSADALGGLLLRVVWPMVQDALGEGLAFGVDPIAVDPAALAEYAPRLVGLTLAPSFRGAPRVDGGRIGLEGRLDVNVTMAPIGGVEMPPPEDMP